MLCPSTGRRPVPCGEVSAGFRRGTAEPARPRCSIAAPASSGFKPLRPTPCPHRRTRPPRPSSGFRRGTARQGALMPVHDDGLLPNPLFAGPMRAVPAPPPAHHPPVARPRPNSPRFSPGHGTALPDSPPALPVFVGARQGRAPLCRFTTTGCIPTRFSPGPRKPCPCRRPPRPSGGTQPNPVLHRGLHAPAAPSQPAFGAARHGGSGPMRATGYGLHGRPAHAGGCGPSRGRARHAEVVGETGWPARLDDRLSSSQRAPCPYENQESAGLPMRAIVRAGTACGGRGGTGLARARRRQVEDQPASAVPLQKPAEEGWVDRLHALVRRDGREGPSDPNLAVLRFRTLSQRL